jgi:hypothetical protein
VDARASTTERLRRRDIGLGELAFDLALIDSMFVIRERMV